MSVDPTNPHSHNERDGASDESLQEVHAKLLNRQDEPKGGYQPMPLFLLGLISTLIFICSVYIVHFRGGFDSRVTDGRFDPATLTATGPKILTVEQMIAIGQKDYATCQACHQPNGQGLPGVFPPLAGSDWVTGSDERLVAVLLHGLTGEIEVNGNTYNGMMPAFGASGFGWNDQRIANVITYIRQEWGNEAEPVMVDRVKEVRERLNRTAFWTAAELEQLQ